jgi:hypothetical protein
MKTKIDNLNFCLHIQKTFSVIVRGSSVVDQKQDSGMTHQYSTNKIDHTKFQKIECTKKAKRTLCGGGITRLTYFTSRGNRKQKTEIK